MSNKKVESQHNKKSQVASNLESNNINKSQYRKVVVKMKK